MGVITMKVIAFEAVGVDADGNDWVGRHEVITSDGIHIKARRPKKGRLKVATGCQCQRCGETYSYDLERDPKGTRRYCSPQCAALCAADVRAKPLKKCGVCGGEFRAKRPTQKYCCQECQWESMRQPEIKS